MSDEIEEKILSMYGVKSKFRKAKTVPYTVPLFSKI